MVKKYSLKAGQYYKKTSNEKYSLKKFCCQNPLREEPQPALLSSLLLSTDLRPAGAVAQAGKGRG